MSSLIDSVKSLSDLVHYSRRQLPGSPDGLTGSEAAPAVLGKPMDHGKLYDLIDDIQAAIKRGSPIDLDDGTVAAIIDALKHANTTGIDDRYMLLEKVFTLTSRLPPGSIIQQKITDAIVGLLYRDLPHPPGTYLGKKWAFRSADGSYNNINIPDLGKARMPYTRSVQSRNPIPYSSLPDPDLLFDALLKRDGPAPHPSGISSLLFAFANLIIHSLFKTDEIKKNINNTSSYLDLSPLYGDSEAIQKTVRQCDGRGLLWEDCFADQRMLMMPPSTPALLIMFCRNHNFIARRLLQINERRTYTDPPPQNDPAALMTQDDDIFNRARLINCAHFTNVILSDYIGAILNLTKEGNTWSLNPLERIREFDHELIPRGEGNSVSVEFNLLYRWHATISEPDEKWTEDLFRKMFPDKPIHSLTVADFKARVAELRFGPSAAATTANPTPQAQEISNSAHGTTGTDQSGAAVTHLPTATNGSLKLSNGWPDGTMNTTAHTKNTSASTTSTAFLNSDDDFGLAVPTRDPRQLNRSKSSASSSSAGAPSGPRTWTFGGLVRDPKTGKYDDDKLADMLQNATETPAQAFRARGTPEVLRVVEVMAIEQARQWGVCTMNEFRQFIGLKAYEDFEEWNPDPEIANCARALYGHIDNLELYVGMQAEQTKVPGPGAGLCPGYTISRAILGDAVALTRGDRFLTTDMTPYNLTAWGYQDCAHDNRNGAFGSGLSKILLRNLPGNYTYNSVYGLFAFYTPKTMVSVLSNLRIKELYDFVRPGSEQEITTVNSYAGVNQVLFDYQSFKVTYERTMKRLTNGYGFFLAFDEPAKHLKDLKLMREALFPTPNTMSEYGAYYRTITAHLIETKSFSLVGKGTRSLDIVRDVFNLVPVHWISRKIAGIPLKTKETPLGVHTEQEVYQFMALCFTYIFLNVQPETGWILEENSEKVAKLLQGYVKGHIDAIRSRKLSISKLKDSFLTWFTGEKDESREFLKRLAASNRSSDELSYNVFGIIVASCANWSMAASLILNFYLDDARKVEREEIIKLVTSEKAESKESSSLLLGYILEALRLDPQAPGIFRQASVDAEIKEGNGLAPVRVNKGEEIFVSLRNANQDPTTFPNPQKVDPTRPLDRYKLFGAGMHSCLGQFFTQATMPEVMRCVFSLKNIRRAPGESGKLNRFRADLFGSTINYCYVDAKGNVSPFPGSMLIQYDI
ncbi:hypothetical protein FRC04_004915 [Tulasnella sp. 424]|nr:hypothetical protein FRC04_004915 [Tulasnella sp. 424]KAG8973482.1 hypothetical protein FRC05_008756 [Tulasnella sp. 425]